MADPINRDNFKLDKEPSVWRNGDKELVRNLFIWASKNKVNDINISSYKKISVKKDGKIYFITKKTLSDEDVKNILFILYETEGARSELLSGNDKDFAYEVRTEEGDSYRYRVNATAVYAKGSSCIQITARTIVSNPPRTEDIAIEQDILDNYIKKQGLVVLTGSTGTGKSTTLAALIRRILEDPDANKKILTYEAPIEFIYENVKTYSCDITQTEIYNHLSSFSAAVRNALRRAPDIILIGEARDKETIGETIIASQTGHLVFTTTHTNGVAETIKRMVNEFDPTERNARAVDIINALNMIVSQKLVQKIGGGRVALREYLIFDNEMKKRLQSCELDVLSFYCQEELINNGVSFYESAKRNYEAGLITKEVLEEEEAINKALEKQNEILRNNASKK